MERITIPKNSMAKNIILSGLEGRGFTLAKKTRSESTPIYLYYKRSIKSIVIFRCGFTEDEMVIINYTIPGKVQVIIDEYHSINDPSRSEIADILEKILDRSYFKEHVETIYL